MAERRRREAAQPSFPRQFADNLAAVGSVALSVSILLSQGCVRLGTGLGAPEFVTINMLVALISLVVLFSPAAKEVSLDSGLTRRSPGLSPVLTNRRQRG